MDLAAVKHIAKMLTVNTVLESVILGGFEVEGLNLWARYLPKVCGVKYLKFGHLYNFRCMTTESTVEAFVTALERNKTIYDIDFHVSFDEEYADDDDYYFLSLAHEMSSRVDHLLALNRGGRKILTAANVPTALWPRILARSSDDPAVLYFFLCEKPADIIGKKPATVSRKRKRDE